MSKNLITWLLFVILIIPTGIYIALNISSTVERIVLSALAGMFMYVLSAVIANILTKSRRQNDSESS